MKNLANSTAQAYRDNAEPSVEEVMSDPIVRTLMRADAVEDNLLQALQAHIDELREQLAASPRLQ